MPTPGRKISARLGRFDPRSTPPARRYDVRGFGRSSQPDKPFQHHADLFQLLGISVSTCALRRTLPRGRISLDLGLEHLKLSAAWSYLARVSAGASARRLTPRRIMWAKKASTSPKTPAAFMTALGATLARVRISSLVR